MDRLNKEIMQPETRRELWAVIQAFCAIYCCVIGTWALFRPPQAPIPSSASGPVTPSSHIVWWFWILIAGFIVCALTLAVGTVVNIFSRRLEQVEGKATPTVDGILAGLPKQSPEPKPQRWKPPWQKLQWANAQRVRLEGEVSKLGNKIDGINQAHAEQIARIERAYESDVYRSRQIRDEITAEKTDLQKQLASAENKATELQARLLALAPRVVGVRFGIQTSDNRSGLWVMNDGEPAYDVTMPDVVQVGTSKLLFHTKIVPRLTKSDSEVLCEAWIEREPHNILLADGLFDQMVSQRIDAIEVPIGYKDGDNRGYVTRCRIERNVSVNGGIAVRYVEQKLENAAQPKLSQYPVPQLRAKIVAMVSELQGFLGAHGEEPAVSPLYADRKTEEFQHKLRSVLEPWQAKFMGDYCLQFGELIPKLRDEMRARAHIDDQDLNNDIEWAAKSRDRCCESVNKIAKRLWELGIKVNT
jgi:hypothetical protein